MRVGPKTIIFLTVIAAAGCLGRLDTIETDHVFRHGDLVLSTQQTMETTAGSGIVIYTVEGGTNATFALLGDSVQSTSDEATLTIAVNTADGFFRLFRFDEYAFPTERTGLAAPTFVDAKRAEIIITWANIEAAQWTLYSMPDARATLLHRGSATFLPWTEFPDCSAEPGAIVPPATRCAASLGSPGGQLYSVVKMRAYPAAVGNVQITDAEGERSFSVEAMDTRNPRYFLTSNGTTRFEVEVGGHPDFRLYVTAAEIPSGLLPTRMWKEFAEPNDQGS